MIVHVIYIFRGNMSPAHLVRKLHLKKKGGDKPSKAFAQLLISPTVQKQPKYFCFCTVAAAALHTCSPLDPLSVTLLTQCFHHGPCRHMPSLQDTENRNI